MTRSTQRRSWLTLAAWLVAVAALAALGTRLEGRLSPMSLTVPGTPSSRAEAMLQTRFGNTIPIAVLLQGPPSDVDRQGRLLVERLRALHAVQVLSPFDRQPSASLRNAVTAPPGRQDAGPRQSSDPGSAEARTGLASTAANSLRPRPGTAFVLVNYIRPSSAAVAVVPSTERTIARTVRRPVRSYLTGVAVIGRALQQATLASTERAETIALPILVLVLLLVFRSPVAAAVPLLMGAATVTAGHGLLWIASFLTPINSLGMAIAAMMSLALGVDYALLMVSRVRQEVSAGNDHQTAIAIARRAAGRTIAAAGGTLALAMLAASGVATAGLLGPVAIGVVISGVLSVALALSAMPAILRLLGPNLDRWQIQLSRSPGRRRGRLAATAERLIAHPAMTVPSILAAMLALAAPAGALRMGPPDASELPSASPARQAVAAVQRAIGPGWSAPFVIVASAKHGAMTTGRRIDALIRWQHAIARQPGVAAVLGPGSVAGAQQALAEAHEALASAPRRLAGARAGVVQLRAGLGAAGAGVAELRRGLGSAQSASRSLAAGAQQAATGAGRLAHGAGQAHAGAARLAGETGRARAGAKRLARETRRAHGGAERLSSETARAHAGARRLQNGLSQASAGSARLAGGLDEAAEGAQRLADSDAQLASGAAELAQGLDALDDTVHVVLDPVRALAEQLRAWARWLQSLQGSDELLRARVSHALSELQAMTTGRGDPHYQALARDLQAIGQLTEGEQLAHLGELQRQLYQALERLSQLPSELARLTDSVDRMRNGADRLAVGTKKSEQGARSLSDGLQRLSSGGHALSDGLTGLSGGAARLSGGLGLLAGGNRQLANGLGRLAGGDRRLAGGLGLLAGGEARLTGGLGQLADGGGQLVAGLGRLAGGNGRLANGLAAGNGRLGALAGGLGKARRPLDGYASMLARYQQGYKLLHAEAPGALDSGYLVLTALDGTPSATREQVAQLVNVDGGGQAARMMVVAASPPNSAATAALSARLRKALPSLAASTGSDVQIGQGAQYLLDYRNANTARFPWLVLALAIVAALTLIAVLRALPLPLLAVALNLATIAVALGALQLLTEARLMGGPGYVDAVSGAGIMAIMFVLSIDYEVFLLTRIREAWSAGASADEAIRHGLRHTAGVITGSAAIMTAVFMAFAAAEVVPLRQFGTGLTIAVLLDATVVRLVLLPAMMRLAGPRVWWLPGWLERRLPTLEH